MNLKKNEGILQHEICKVITNIGGRIKYKKEMGFPARLYYYISKKEPVINIEAYFLGERFAVIIGGKMRKGKNMFNSSGYRIIVCDNLADFERQFNEFKEAKLREA